MIRFLNALKTITILIIWGWFTYYLILLAWHFFTEGFK
jgi:hypothetical protein